MTKVIISILVILALIVGSLGYYGYTLNQQISLLSEHGYTLSQQISLLSERLELSVHKQDIQMHELSNEINQVNEEINNVSREFDAGLDAFRTSTVIDLRNLERDVDRTVTEIDALEREVEDVNTEISRTIDLASTAYAKVRQSVVRISDGESTIGSGFLCDDNHVITAYHVVENISDRYVVFPDGTVSLTTTAGVSKQSDIAILTLKNKASVQPLALADSSKIKIGQPIIAIGTPFDLNDTLNYGIISQAGRFIKIDATAGARWVANLIQFDAPVNPGNSGGPLLNSDGEVIGMVIARVRADEGDGIHYAVSSNKIQRVSALLIEEGHYDYPRMGIGITDLTPEKGLDEDLETINGVLVTSISSNSPAEKSGVNVGDIIIAIGDATISEVASLTSYIGEHTSPGDIATLTIIRNSSTIELDLEFDKQPR